MTAAMTTVNAANSKKAHPMKNAKFAEFKGTAKDFEAAGIELNGLPVDSVALSVLAKFKVVRVVGKADKAADQRGKASAIYLLRGRPGQDVTIPEITRALPIPKKEGKKAPVAKAENPQALMQQMRDLLQRMEQAGVTA